MPRKLLYASILTFIAVFSSSLLSCSSSTLQHDSATKLANPAVEKCLKDGYALHPKMTNGVPTGGLCVDEANSRACEEWAYYRGECTFDPTPLPAKKPQKQ